MLFNKTENKDCIIYTDDTLKIEFALCSDIDGIRIVKINDINTEKINYDDLLELLKLIYRDATKAGIPVKIETSKRLLVISDESNTLVKDIDPIDFDGEFDINDEISLFMCIESPVRNACMMLNQMGIKTLMSSANKNDVESRNTKIDWYRHIRGEKHYNLGNGYAWIMIDWDSLSIENKQKLIMLNNGSASIELSDDEKESLMHNCVINNFDMTQKELIGFFEIFNYYKFLSDRSQFFHLDTLTEEDNYYQMNRHSYACHNSLCNYGDDFRTVVIRYPLNESTTVSQVDNYFMTIIKQLSFQEKINIHNPKL